MRSRSNFSIVIALGLASALLVGARAWACNDELMDSDSHEDRIVQALAAQKIKNRVLPKLNGIPDTAKIFTLDDVLSLSTPRLFSRRGIAGLKAMLGFLINEEGVDTIGLARHADRAEEILFRQYPELKEDLLPADYNHKRDFDTWFKAMTDRFGSALVLLQVTEEPEDPDLKLENDLKYVKSINPNIRVITSSLDDVLPELSPEEDGHPFYAKDPFSCPGFTQVFLKAIGATDSRPHADILTSAFNRLEDEALRVRLIRHIARSTEPEVFTDFFYKLLGLEKKNQVTSETVEWMAYEFVD